jgi:Tol biopolymer transport system component
MYLADLTTGERRLLGPATGVARPLYANGALFYVRGRTLFSHPFDLKKLRLEGEPTPVAQQIETHGSAFSMFTVSQTGVLCYQSGSIISEFRWVDRHGNLLGVFGDAAENFAPTLDAAHRRFVFSLADPITASFDVWSYDMDRNTARRLTFNPADELVPIVSPDGKRVAFMSNRTGNPQLFVKSLDGTDEERAMTSTQPAKFPRSWSADGRFIAFREIGATNTQSDIDILDLRQQTERRFLASPFAETDAAFAPTGRWIAYVTDESGLPEVYVTTFPDGSRRWRISSGGGSQPRWRADEKELFYYSASGNLMTVPIESRSDFKAGVPQRLFAYELRPARDDSREYDVSPDGQQFLINTTAGRQKSLPLTVALGWKPAP